MSSWSVALRSVFKQSRWVETVMRTCKPLVTLAKDGGAGGSVTAGEAGLNGILSPLSGRVHGALLRKVVNRSPYTGGQSWYMYRILSAYRSCHALKQKLGIYWKSRKL